MRRIRFKVVSIVVCISLLASLSLGFVPYENIKYEEAIENKLKEEFKNYLKNNQDANEYIENDTKKIIDNNENVTIMVMLKADSAIDDAKDKDEAILLEKNIKEEQKKIIAKVEKITATKVEQSFGYLVNGFSIQGKYSDIDKIKKVDGVKEAYASQKYKTSMYGAQKITQATATWKDYGYKGEGMVIAVIDTEFDVEHKDFIISDNSKSKLSKEKVESIINEKLEGRGKYFSEKFPYGYNYVDYSTNLKSSETHGQHVTGIIGANGKEEECNSYKAIKGVAPEAQILAMRVGDDNGALIGNVILAIEDSVKLGADVINMSFGDNGYVAKQEELIRVALNKANELGVVCVQSAGNAQLAGSTEILNSPTNPYNLKDTSVVDSIADNTIMVASMENNASLENAKATFTINNFSSFGTSPDLELKPDITAPGGNICSTVNDDGYAYMSGTSMASPHVAGGQALIMQALQEKMVGANRYDLSVLSKNLMMNTAMVLKEKSNFDIPYSPRRQGAGLLQIEEAIRNDVVLTDYETKKASVSLKNIQNQKEFKIKLSNIGKEDRAYVLKSQKLYSEITDELGDVKEIQVNGGSITFDKEYVQVKAGEEVSINCTVYFPKNSIEKQNFVEGFIRCESIDKNIPSLSMPVLAFYGDYSEEKILDAPLYSSESKTQLTKLTSDYNRITLGRYFNNVGITKYVDDYIAISPNDDNMQDRAKLNMYLLRNSKKTTIQILDENKNVLETPKVYRDGYKLLASLNNYNDYEFDGRIYDITTGGKRTLEDGQYYIRVKTIGYTEDAKEQNTDIPIKIDTKAPELDIKSLASYEDEEGEVVYVLRFEAEDDFSGIYRSIAISTDNNSEGTQYFDAIQKKNGLYEVEFKLGTKNRVNRVNLSMSDNAGNVGYTSKELFIEPENVVNLYNLHDGMVFNRENYSQVGFFLRGDVRSDVDKLYINDQPMYMNDGIINAILEFEEGNNELNIVAKNAKGKVIYSTIYNVYKDMVMPSIKSASPFNEFRNYIPEENEDKVEVEFEFSEELKEVIFDVGGKEIPYRMVAGKYILYIEPTGQEQILDIIYTDRGDNKKEELYFFNKNKDPYVPQEVVFQTSIGRKYTYLSEYENDEYTIRGNFIDSKYYESDDIEILVNDKKVELANNNSMSYKYKLIEGKNIVNVVVKNSEGVLFSDEYILIYDKKAPVITFDKNISDILTDVKPNGRIYISNNKEPVSSINLKGSITDNLSGYSFYINGDYVLDVNIKNEYEGQYGDLFTRNFEKNIELNPGLNYIKYDAYDFINGGPANYNGKVFEIYNGSIIPDKPVITEVNISNKEKEITLTNTNYDLDHLEWSIDGKNYTRYTEPIILTSDTKIYARAISYTGDYSEIETLDVVFDKIKDVKALKISVEKSEDETSAVVTISSDYDDINRIEYSFDNQNFVVYDGPIEINKTSTIYAVAYDELGNSSEVVLEKIELKEKKNEKDEPKEEEPDKKDDDGNMTQTSDESIKQIIMFLILMEGSILVMLKLRKKVE